MEEEDGVMKDMNFPLVIDCDMHEEERIEAVETIVTAIEKYPADLEQAAKSIKDLMDKKYGQYFHCIVGAAFGFCCEFEISHKLQMAVGPVGILLFKACN
eukprot:gnl/Dysnectes_brevis/1007_a1123_4212.p1 GENE.gnl/Dysnectes_brevis/1007_a1123_4212~~gnl/Dysnectes_brevis/1007_a1123_4212.p1  ORF type:complete len:100 (-),score=5.69 gnl/Dysnectes_brevis/1007_a1123_4212:105-404(-)